MSAIQPRLGIYLFLAIGLAALPTATATACPFCSAVALTFSQEMAEAGVTVVAEMVEPPAPAEPESPDGGLNVSPSMAKFAVREILKGKEVLGDVKEFQAVYFGDSPVGTHFLVNGTQPPEINWSSPVALSERARKYVLQLPSVPPAGADRLAFFQQYFEDSDELLARDSYDEFAIAPYADLIALRDRMEHNKLVNWIKDPRIAPSHRRLYLTMLGVCGAPADLPMLEGLIKSTDRKAKAGLDALIACYLTIKGADGVGLIEDLYLKNQKSEYTDTYAAIMALRFHGQEAQVIPKERILVALRHMLDRPPLADLIIPDLARWQDWSVIDRLVALFKNAKDDSNWVRVPVVNYLRACPLPQAKVHLAELEKIDPESVKRASSFFPLTSPAPAPAGKDTKAGAGGKQPAAADGKKTEAKPAAATEKKSPTVDNEAAIVPTGAAILGTAVVGGSLAFGAVIWRKRKH